MQTREKRERTSILLTSIPLAASSEASRPSFGKAFVLTEGSLLFQTSAFRLPESPRPGLCSLNFDGVNGPQHPRCKHDPAIVECVHWGLRIWKGESAYS